MIITCKLSKGDIKSATAAGTRVATVGPMVGTKVRIPQIKPLSNARGTFSHTRPAHVTTNTSEAEIVMPANQPPRASLHSAKSLLVCCR